MILSKEVIDEQIRKLETVRTELTILVPRLTSLYRANAEACVDRCDAVIQFLNETKESLQT